jgi:hypothetical protein
MTLLNMWIVIAIAIGFVGALYILVLQAQLQAYRRYTIVVTPPTEESGSGCLGIFLLLLAILLLMAVLLLSLAS